MVSARRESEEMAAMTVADATITENVLRYAIYTGPLNAGGLYDDVTAPAIPKIDMVITQIMSVGLRRQQQEDLFLERSYQASGSLDILMVNPVPNLVGFRKLMEVPSTHLHYVTRE